MAEDHVQTDQLISTFNRMGHVYRGLQEIKSQSNPVNGAALPAVLNQVLEHTGIVIKVLDNIALKLQLGNAIPAEQGRRWDSSDQIIEALKEIFRNRNGDNAKSLMLQIMHMTLDSAKSLDVDRAGLEDAIKKWEEPSSGHSFSLGSGQQYNNTGGHQFNATGAGKQLNNTGTGPQNIHC